MSPPAASSGDAAACGAVLLKRLASEVSTASERLKRARRRRMYPSV
jgi:hypothetical protein